MGGDQPRTSAERSRPGRDVRSLAAGGDAYASVGVRVFGHRLVQTDDDVEEQVAERADVHGGEPTIERVNGGGGRSRLGSFLLGGLLGGLAGVAASRLRHSGAARRNAQPGLRAFEGAPCYQELVEREAESKSDRDADARV